MATIWTSQGDAHDGNLDNDNVTYQILIYDSAGDVKASTTPVTGPGITGGALGTIRFGAMARGSYELVLAVNDGSEESRDSISFAYESDLQIGQFKFGMEDLAIPVGGVDLRIARTYDSLNPRLGDFGYSWTYSLLDMQMEFNETREDRSDVFGEKFNVRVGGDWDVTLTMPDGQRATFRFNPGNPDVLSGAYNNPSWDSPAGITAKLTPNFSPEIDPTYYGGVYWHASGPMTPFENFDMPGFTLSMDDGTQYVFEREDLGTLFQDPPDGSDPDPDFSVDSMDTGIEALGPPRLSRIILPTSDEIRITQERTDSDGNIEFKVEHFIPDATAPDGGYTTSAMLFRRNDKRVISEVYGPDALNGDSIVGIPNLKYEYDDQTNLVHVLALVDRPAARYELTTFLYEKQPQFPHYITKILDARNIPMGRTEYYSNPSDTANYGKIKSVTNSKGDVTSFVHITPDPGLDAKRPPGYPVPVIREEITLTPEGFDSANLAKTVHEADAYGNVIYSKDTSGFEVWSKYVTRENLSGDQHLDQSDPQSQIPVLVEQRHTVHEQGVDRVYVQNWEYTGAGTVAQELAPTRVIATHLLNQMDNLRITRFDYNSLGQPAKVFDPLHSAEESAIYRETKYDEDQSSATYGQITAQYFHNPGAGADPQTPSDGQLLSEQHYFDDSTLFRGMLWYSVDTQGTPTVNEYYSGEVGGRLGDLKSVQVLEAGKTEAEFAEARYISKTTFTYDSLGNRLTESRWRYVRDVFTGNPSGEEVSSTTTYEYDAKNRLKKTIDATGATSETTYNALGKTATTTDRYNATTTFYYDRSGESSGTKYPDGTVSYRATYYENGGAIGLLKCQVTEDRHFAFASGEKATGTRTVYDSVGRVIRSERVRNLIINVSSNGDVDDTTYVSCDPLTRTITEYLADGRVLDTFQDINLDGAYSTGDSMTRYEYSADGLIKTTYPPDVQDGSDLIHTEIVETHDVAGNLLTSQTVSYKNGIEESQQPVTKYFYDDLNRATETWSYPNESLSDGAPVSKSLFDWSGRAWLQIDADNHAKAMIYNDAGQLSWVITDVDPALTELPGTLPTDITGWVTWAKNGRGSAVSTATHYEYDELGQEITQIDGNNNATHFSYDKLGRRTARYLPSATALSEGEEWSYDWDFAANQTSTVTKRPNVIKHLDFKNQQLFSVFDDMGRLIQKKSDATTVLVDYDYTAAGQRARMVDNQNNPLASPRETRYVYDEQNRLCIKNTPEGTLTYEYEEGTGLLKSISAKKGYNFPASLPYTLANVTALSTDPNPNGAYMAYNYDERRRLSKVNEDISAADADAAYSYDSVGNQAKMTYRNDVETVYTYNFRNQLRWMRSYKTSDTATTLASFDYDDADPNDDITWPNSGTASRVLAVSGLRRGVREVMPAAGTAYPRLVAYNYDNLNRLTRESLYTGAWASESGYVQYDDTPGYDPVGNRGSRTAIGFTGLADGSLTYSTYTADDWLGPIQNGQSGTVGASFDANGNTTEFDLNADGTADQAVKDQYDFENRLVTATRSIGAIELVYDGDGNRVKKMADGIVTLFLVDDRNPTGYPQVLEERSAVTGDPTVKYVYGLDLISQTRGSDTHYYGYDGLGSVRYLTSSSDGLVTDTYTYDAFGIQIAFSGTTVNGYRYTGEQRDEYLNAYYLRARYYNPELGRFWTMDTFPGIDTDPQSLHKYVYGHNNPINSADPSGHFDISSALNLWIDASLTVIGRISFSKVMSTSGTCGPDVTAAVINTMTDVERTFKNAPYEKKIFAATSMYENPYDFMVKGWDIQPLFELGYTSPVDFGNGSTLGTGSGAYTVQYGFPPKVYYAGSVNYMLFGRMFNLIHEFFRDPITGLSDPVWSEEAAVAATRSWKALGHYDLFNKYATEAVAFVRYGYSIGVKNPAATALPLASNPKNVGADKSFPWRWAGLRDDF